MLNSKEQELSERLKVLEQREQLFQAVLDGFPEAIEIIDHQFNVLYLNSAAARRSPNGVPGYHEAGGKCYQVFYNKGEPCTYCPALNTFERGEPGFVLLKDQNFQNRETRFEELLLMPVKSDQKHAEKGVKWVVEIAKDVTREKEMEQQLISSERLVTIGEMAASIAHEFNNPLGIVLGFTQDLLTEVDPADPRYHSLRIIEEEARRCKKIMRDLMEFGRPTPSQFTEVDVPALIRKAVDLISGRALKQKVKSRVDVQGGLPQIWADPQQVMQVLVNLFFNAIEAMPDGGKLTIKGEIDSRDRDVNRGHALAPGSDEIVIQVEDTGSGIHPSDLPKIFRTFFTTKQKKGMGLGLSICESIMKGHGGRMAVESSPGKGTVFYLYFPCKKKEFAG
jgi:signal transduction histidine kinase